MLAPTDFGWMPICMGMMQLPALSKLAETDQRWPEECLQADVVPIGAVAAVGFNFVVVHPLNLVLSE